MTLRLLRNGKRGQSEYSLLPALRERKSDAEGSQDPWLLALLRVNVRH